MLEDVAAKIATAIQEWQSGNRLASWEVIRQPCKEAIVYLETCGQPVVAARVERECEALKQAWLAAPDDSESSLPVCIADLGEELRATMAALVRFQRHLGRSLEELKSDDRGKVDVPVFRHSPWPGSDQWENWGIGLANDKTWRLYHFLRRNGCWIPHHHVTLQIPAGIPHDLARKFLRFGFVSLFDAHDVLRKHAKGAIDEQIRASEVIAKTKSPMSRLRSAIRQAVHGEGHHPKGRPISSPTKHGNNWQARVRFGMVERRDNGGNQFKFKVSY